MGKQATIYLKTFKFANKPRDDYVVESLVMHRKHRRFGSGSLQRNLGGRGVQTYVSLPSIGNAYRSW